jgi:hypothetical protein
MVICSIRCITHLTPFAILSHYRNCVTVLIGCVCCHRGLRLQAVVRTSAGDEVISSRRRWVCVPLPVLYLFVRRWACVGFSTISAWR